DAAMSGPPGRRHDRGAPRLRRAATNARGAWGAMSGPPNSVDAAMSGPPGRRRDRGAPRLRRGATNVRGAWGAISGPPNLTDGIQHLGDDLEATEGRHQVGAGIAAAHVVDERLRHLDAHAQRTIAGLAEPRADVVGDRDAGHL